MPDGHPLQGQMRLKFLHELSQEANYVSLLEELAVLPAEYAEEPAIPSKDDRARPRYASWWYLSNNLWEDDMSGKPALEWLRRDAWKKFSPPRRQDIEHVALVVGILLRERERAEQIQASGLCPSPEFLNYKDLELDPDVEIQLSSFCESIQSQLMSYSTGDYAKLADGEEQAAAPPQTAETEHADGEQGSMADVEDTVQTPAPATKERAQVRQEPTTPTPGDQQGPTSMQKPTTPSPGGQQDAKAPQEPTTPPAGGQEEVTFSWTEDQLRERLDFVEQLSVQHTDLKLLLSLSPMADKVERPTKDNMRRFKWLWSAQSMPKELPSKVHGDPKELLQWIHSVPISDGALWTEAEVCAFMLACALVIQDAHLIQFSEDDPPAHLAGSKIEFSDATLVSTLIQRIQETVERRMYRGEDNWWQAEEWKTDAEAGHIKK